MAASAGGDPDPPRWTGGLRAFRAAAAGQDDMTGHVFHGDGYELHGLIRFRNRNDLVGFGRRLGTSDLLVVIVTNSRSGFVLLIS